MAEIGMEKTMASLSVHCEAPIRDGRYVTFGAWPQSRKAPNVSVTERGGRYFGSDGAEYVLYKEQYFKIEPLLWWILSEENGTALLLCEKIIAGMHFDAKKRAYEESEVRAWLNGTFYEQAFDAVEKKFILTCPVGGKRTEPFVMDNVFLPYAELDGIFRKSGGLLGEHDNGRVQKHVTSFAFEMGADPYHLGKDPYTSEGCTWHGEGFYWLRKLNTRGSGNAFAVSTWGDGIYSYPLDETSGGVAPEIRIRLR